MKITLAVSAAAFLVASSTAFAADPIMPAPAPTVPVVDDSFIWDGFYAGLNIGYGWGTVYDDVGDVLVIGPDNADAVDGIFGGAQLGYNIDLGGFVLGVEGDIQVTGMSQTFGVPGGDLVVGLDYFGTVRGRLGVAFDKVLPYVTGGLAYAQGYIDGTDIALDRDSQFHTGWTVGVGAEYAATESVSVKAEFLYMDFGDETYDIGLPPLTGSFDAHTVRVGANFHF